MFNKLTNYLHVMMPLLFSTLLLAAVSTDWGYGVQHYAGQSLLFQIRQYLNKAPALDPRLKIFAFDDNAFAHLQFKKELSVQTWARLINFISGYEPKVILIDSHFAAYRDEGQNTDVAALFRHMNTVPIYVGGFLSKTEILLRTDHPLDASTYQLSTYERLPLKERNLPVALAEQGMHFYSHNPAYSPVFKAAGIINSPAQSRLFLFTALNEKQVIPHLSLFAADYISMIGSQLLINKKPVPLDGQGKLVVNWADRSSLFNQVKSLKSMFQAMETGKKIDDIKKGDVVFLVPEFYTGHNDFRDTPLGRWPGSFVLASVMSSIMTGKFLNAYGGNSLLFLLFTLLPIGMFYLRGAMAFVTTFIAIAASFLTVIVLLFIELNIMVGWTMPLLGFAMSSIAVGIVKTRQHERRIQRVKQALTGAIDHNLLREIVKDPASIDFSPQEKELTVMFIDIVNFSKYSQQHDAAEIFNTLKSFFAEINKIIYANGGITDRTLGDGLLCYFGHDFLNNKRRQRQQADSALKAAIEIQRKFAVKSNADFDFKLRIGMNYAPCCIGDLGDGKKIDFTLIGNSVNLAKRLESHCQPGCIIVSQSLMNEVKESQAMLQLGSKELKLQVKNIDSEILAYELKLVS